MTITPKDQTIQALYLSYYLGAGMPELAKLFLSLPFQPEKTNNMLHSYKDLLDGEIKFAITK
jgi:hypothetical protein